MDLNWLECLFLGLVSGFADMLPISAQAHKAVFLKIFGSSAEPPLLRLAIRVAILVMLYICCSAHIQKFLRQLRLARIPKKHRKRPLDHKVLSEFKVLRMMAIPLIASFFLYSKTESWGSRLNITALLLLLNGVILYLPKLLPTGDKTALSMTSLDGLLMGLGGGLAFLPGVSSVGAMLSVASACGAERQCALSLTYLAQFVVCMGSLILDVLAVVNENVVFSIPVVISCFVAAVAAAAGTYLGVRVMRLLARHTGFDVFFLYSFGAGLFSFIIYLLV